MKFTELLDDYLIKKSTLEIMEEEKWNPKVLYAAETNKDDAAARLNQFVESLNRKQES